MMTFVLIGRMSVMILMTFLQQQVYPVMMMVMRHHNMSNDKQTRQDNQYREQFVHCRCKYIKKFLSTHHKTNDLTEQHYTSIPVNDLLPAFGT
jgi:hypothetical protein